MQVSILLERDEDGWIVATVPGFEGCISQGETEAEAVANIREALELWLESQAELARNSLGLGLRSRLITV